MAHLEIEGTQAPFSDPPSVFGLPSPYYKESHHHLRKVVREWVNEHLTPNTGDWDEEGETPQWAYRQAAKDGLLVPLACGAQLEKWMVDEKDGRGVIGGIKVSILLLYMASISISVLVLVLILIPLYSLSQPEEWDGEY